MTTLEPIDPPAGPMRKVKREKPWFARAPGYEVQHFRDGATTYMRVTNNKPPSGKRHLGELGRNGLGLPLGREQWYRVKNAQR